MFGSTAAGARGDRVQTVALDDYVSKLQLDRVDFIKMDIEGAELKALQGARHTIAHFQPKLAICLYHQWNDAFTIPQAILDTGVDYRFTFKWVQLKDGWEAILLACPASRLRSPQPAPVVAAQAGGDHLEAALAILSKGYLRKCAQVEALRRERAAPAERTLEPAPAA
jgi:Methyltransferase FkbM domain